MGAMAASSSSTVETVFGPWVVGGTVVSGAAAPPQAVRPRVRISPRSRASICFIRIILSFFAIRFNSLNLSLGV